MRRIELVTGGLLAGLLCAVALATAAPPAPKPAPQGTPAKTLAAQPPPVQTVLRFSPKVRPMSTYTLQGRVEVTTRDVTFEAPDAYKAGFNFWAGRMKGEKRAEVYEMSTMTQDADAKGVVTFRRTIPRFDLEVVKQGQNLASPPAMQEAVATLVFDGTMDLMGNVKTMKKTAGPDDPDIQGLAIPEMSRLFPEVDTPHDLRIGDSFQEERPVRLLSKLGIAGLEDVTYRSTRVFTLKSLQKGLATFEVKVTYADDPAYKVRAEKTTLHISGGGSGTSVYQVERGVFKEARLPTTMRIDIEAPLRPLSDRPEPAKSVIGKSHIDLDLLVSGQQEVRRVWGDDTD